MDGCRQGADRGVEREASHQAAWRRRGVPGSGRSAVISAVAARRRPPQLGARVGVDSSLHARRPPARRPPWPARSTNQTACAAAGELGRACRSARAPSARRLRIEAGGVEELLAPVVALRQFRVGPVAGDMHRSAPAARRTARRRGTRRPSPPGRPPASVRRGSRRRRGSTSAPPRPGRRRCRGRSSRRRSAVAGDAARAPDAAPPRSPARSVRTRARAPAGCSRPAWSSAARRSRRWRPPTTRTGRCAGRRRRTSWRARRSSQALQGSVSSGRTPRKNQNGWTLLKFDWAKRRKCCSTMK